MLNCVERFPRWLPYEYNIYIETKNGLNALLSRNVNNFIDAVYELFIYCTRTHHTTSTALCEYCTLIKDLLEEVDDDPYIEPDDAYYD